MKVETITPVQLRRYRSLGVRNGKKDFSLRLPRGTGKQKVTEKDINARKVKDQRMNFGALGLSQKEISKMKLKKKRNSPQKKVFNADGPISYSLKKSNEKVLNIHRQRGIKKQMLSQLAPSSTEARVLKSTGFNIQFEPPEGVSEDELNSQEKRYYSFQKRTYVSYVNSFLKTYQSLLLKRPNIRQPLQKERHILTGRIIFDKEGHIVSIKILKSTANDDIHDLFESTLKEIRKLPNPPDDLVRTPGNFTIYYQLNINPRL
jgi:hypothetical protein